jgi:tetratricopeptide (TPR) repeat protein
VIRALRMLAVGAILTGLCLSSARADKARLGGYIKAARLLKEWRFDEARAAIDALATRAPDTPETRYLQAEMAFLDGQYTRARALIRDAPESRVFSGHSDLRTLVESTIEATDGFARYDSAGGHFQIYYPPGKDEVLVELAADVLETAYRVIGEDLGYRPKRPVRVELLSRPQDLARVSTLTVQEIETTGTIALCKYGKLMVVTPRATVLGYPWLDTLVHEYVHFVVSAASYDQVPVWLQEGLARFEQSRWRLDPVIKLDGVQENLLASALRGDSLISFDAMHPSMAKLPSAQAAALAFAEVYTLIGFLHERRGFEGIRSIVTRVRNGSSARRAVGEVMGMRFEEVERQWRDDLRQRRLKSAPELAKRTGRARLRSADTDAGSDDVNVGLELVSSDKARRFARLGGLLRARNMPRAAAVEYEKALAAARDDPFVRSKLARTYLELNQYDRAISLAEPLLEADDTDSGPSTTLGAAYLAAGNPAKAVAAFEIALRVHPFDPTVRCGLAEAAEKTAKSALAKRERKACDTLLRN